MQLVVMAALLALAKVGQGCSFSCHLKNVIIPVQSCGTTTNITTTICEGRCYHQDPVYISYVDQPKYNSCNGEWSYEMKYIDGCQVGVPFLVARSCDCTTCNPENTDCGRLHAEIPNC